MRALWVRQPDEIIIEIEPNGEAAAKKVGNRRKDEIPLSVSVLF